MPPGAPYALKHIAIPRGAARFDTAARATYAGFPLGAATMKPGTASATSSAEILGRLIAFPTVSRESNLELIHYIRDTLKPLGADMRLTHDDAGRKANLFATLGPRGEPGMVLSGHTDVVPVEGQAWDTDPFAMANPGRARS